MCKKKKKSTHSVCGHVLITRSDYAYAAHLDKPHVKNLAKHTIYSLRSNKMLAVCVIFKCARGGKKNNILFSLPLHASGGELEMSFWSSNPHLLPFFYTPLLSISVTEADTGGGPDGVCYTCFAVVRLLFIRHRGGSGCIDGPPRRKAFVSVLEEGRRRGMSARRKQMSRLDYHLSPWW